MKKTFFYFVAFVVAVICGITLLASADAHAEDIKLFQKFDGFCIGQHKEEYEGESCWLTSVFASGRTWEYYDSQELPRGFQLQLELYAPTGETVDVYYYPVYSI